MTGDQLLIWLKSYKNNEIGEREILTAVEAYSSASNNDNAIVSGALPPVEFADMLLMDFEISTFDNGDLCWQLAGTKQNYTSAKIYEVLGGNDR